MLMTLQQAGLGLAAVGVGFEVFSAFTSSPWTMRNFGADEEKSSSAKMYVTLGAVFCEAIGLGYSLLAGSAWPFIGTTVIAGLFILIYWQALAAGKAAGSNGWTNQTVTNTGTA